MTVEDFPPPESDQKNAAEVPAMPKCNFPASCFNSYQLLHSTLKLQYSLP